MIKKIAQQQIVRYLFIGGFSYLVEMTILFLLNHVLQIPATASVAISFWIGFIVAYVLQKIVTFQNKETSRRVLAQQLIGYSLLVLWNYGFTLTVVEFFQHNMSVVVLRTIVIAITTTWNYALYKLLFRPVSR